MAGFYAALIGTSPTIHWPALSPPRTRCGGLSRRSSICGAVGCHGGIAGIDGSRGFAIGWCDRQPERQNHTNPKDLAAMMRARRSKATSATSSPTPRAIWSTLSSIPPTSMTLTRHRCCCKRSSTASHGCVMSLHGGFAGNNLNDALRKIGTWTIAIIERSDTTKGFVVLPRRRVVERTLAWLSRNRRLAKDFEQTIVPATACNFSRQSNCFHDTSQDYEFTPDKIEPDT